MAREEELRDIPIPHVSVSGQRSTFSVKSRLTLSGILIVLGLAPLWSQNQQLPLDSSNPLQSAFAYPFTLPPREVERDLTRAMRQIDEQQPLEGLKLLQGLLETREDLLIPPENIAIPVLSQSLKRRVIDIMSKIPAETFLTYEEQFGGEAAVTIAEYRSRDDWEGLSQLSLKYLFTEAGQRLTEEIAERMDLPLDKVRKILKIAREPISLDP